MKFVCEKCGEAGSDKERWFYSPVNLDKLPFQTIEKISNLKCKACGGTLELEEGAYTTLRDGSPYRKPSIMEGLKVKKHLLTFAKNNKAKIKKEKKKLKNDAIH